MSRKFTIKGHSSCSLISNIFPDPLFLLSTPSTTSLRYHTTPFSMENPHSIFELKRQFKGRWSCLFIKRNSNPTLYQFFLSDSNFYCSHLLRSDFSRWINFWEKNNLLFHRFVPSFLCDLIISRFFMKYNWHCVWNFGAVFVQWGELCSENKIWGLQVNLFVIY